MNEPPKPSYLEDVQCRETYAENTQVVLDTGGLLRIELSVNRWTHEVPVTLNRVVPVARIALPAGLAHVLRDQLTNCLEMLKKAPNIVEPPASQMKN